MVIAESDLGRYSYVEKLWEYMRNGATMQPMLINSSYTFRFMSYSGSDLVRSSVAGST